MTNFKVQKREAKRFERLVREFEVVPVELKVNYMQFINALILSPADIDLRVSIRNVKLK